MKPVNDNLYIIKSNSEKAKALIYLSEAETKKLIYLNKYGKEIFGDRVGEKCYSVFRNNSNEPCGFCPVNKNSNIKFSIWETTDKSGKRYFKCYTRQTTGDDGSVLAEGTAYDISKEKQKELHLIESEKKYRILFEKNEDATILIGKGKFINCNNAALKLLGYKTKEEFLSTPQERFYPEYQPSGVNTLEEQIAMMQKAFDEGYCRFEGLRTKADGTKIPVDVMLTALPYNNETIIYAVWRDLSRRYKIEKALKRSKKKLKRIIKTKDKFFSIIAHDLRSPFNALTGLSELLLKNFNKYRPEKQKLMIKLLNETSKETYSLLENLLSWSKAQSGEIRFSPEKIDVNQIIVKILLLEKQSAENKNIELKKITTNDIFVYADKNMLYTILRNLLSNAVKFTPKNGKVRIIAQKTKSDKFVRISVEDTGVGIPENKIKDLFKIGKNISTKGTENETGTGLGLILTKEFVEKNSGKIEVKSKPGQGTVFTVLLPTPEYY